LGGGDDSRTSNGIPDGKGLETRFGEGRLARSDLSETDLSDKRPHASGRNRRGFRTERREENTDRPTTGFTVYQDTLEIQQKAIKLTGYIPLNDLPLSQPARKYSSR